MQWMTGSVVLRSFFGTRESTVAVGIVWNRERCGVPGVEALLATVRFRSVHSLTSVRSMFCSGWNTVLLCLAVHEDSLDFASVCCEVKSHVKSVE
jgi:hypothetical protein